METEQGISQAAQLFKALGNESRLTLLWLVVERPLGVGTLTTLTGLSQPLVSQHLRTLRQSGLVTAERHGREVLYRVADSHISHVISDVLAHVQEPHAPERG